MQEYLAMWKNYANFSDRTSVRGYWMAFLFNFVISLALGFLRSAIPALGLLAGLYSIAALIPGIALTVRRLRDAGKYWTWIFISLIPLVGEIILIVFLCKGTVSDEGVQV